MVVGLVVTPESIEVDVPETDFKSSIARGGRIQFRNVYIIAEAKIINIIL